MKRKRTLSALRNSGGFTFLETTVALILMSVLGVLVWQGTIHVAEFQDRIQRAHREVNGLLVMDARIRSQVSMIRVPYWMPDVPVSEEDGEVRIGFYKGLRQSELFFRFSEGYLLIGCDDGVDETLLQRYGPYEEVVIETARGPTGGAPRVSLSFYGTGVTKDPLVISAALCCSPFVR